MIIVLCKCVLIVFPLSSLISHLSTQSFSFNTIIDSENVLAGKDLERCKQNFPSAPQVEVQEGLEPPRKKIAREKVIRLHFFR